MNRLVQWLDSDRRAVDIRARVQDLDRVDWVRCLPFLALHAGCLAVFVVGWSWTSVSVAAGLYLVRMFGITGVYHRYFAHRTYRTSRPMQFVFALLAASSAQRGPLWWAAHHREHHRTSDTDGDPHSPLRVGFFRAHAGWFMSSRFYETNYRRIQDFARFPELVWLNRFDGVVPVTLALATVAAGFALERLAPSLGVTAMQLFVWGFVISTTVLFHATASINSLAHLFGRRRYDTGDGSRNNFWLALITLGEGWHNNHHQHMGCARQGFYWWEIDVTYYVLKVLSWVRIVWDLKRVPEVAYDRSRQFGGRLERQLGGRMA
jgi:stearoyl-CoA desaturase (delta-9 desaturase)